MLLAEHAQTAEEARKHYEQGVAAGERALGKQAFEEYAGHFWGILETRPYMRAREGLAQCLWEAGQREEAAEHYRELLRLNPDDNQGVRYSLATLLLDLDRDEDLRQARGGVRGRRLGGVGLHQDPAGVPGRGRMPAGQ